jgi:hypothetical protein
MVVSQILGYDALPVSQKLLECEGQQGLGLLVPEDEHMTLLVIAI